MNKKEFKQLVKKQFKGKSTVQQLRLIERCRTTVDNAFDELIEEVTNNRTYCPECKEYYLTKSYKQSSKVENVIETTYTDTGDGDYDMYGEVEYLNIYSICPKGHKRLVNHWYMNTLWERPKRQER